MNREEIVESILQSNIMKKWHWFQYHFSTIIDPHPHPFAVSIISAIEEISIVDEKAAQDLLTKLSTISGSEKDINHYDQLMQVLAEILIITHTIKYKWRNSEFLYEPQLPRNKKNPEFNLQTPDFIFGMEVKSPSIRPYQLIRQTPGYQLVSRSELKNILKDDNITLPRDNPVKDFLISANEKFKGFKEENPQFIGILFIIWDDFINEPLSALLSEASGLFTENSFAKDSEGRALQFPNVDAVFISRQRVQFQQIAGDKPCFDPVDHAMDYGIPKTFPFKVIIKNPHSNTVIPDEIIDCFQVIEPDIRMGTEYNCTDVVLWM